jgi:hypothetical protein
MAGELKAGAEALDDVSKAVKALWEIGEVFHKAYRAATKKLRPDYERCAADFRLICSDLQEYTAGFIGFLEKYRSFSFDEPDPAGRFRGLWLSLQSGDLANLAGQLKFRCSEIDTYYNGMCGSWVREKYGSIVDPARQKAAEDALAKLTKIDAALIEAVTVRVLTPLRSFCGRINDALQAGDLDEARRLHRTLRLETRDAVNALTHDRMRLDEARDAFDEVANPPRAGGRGTRRSAK